MKRKVIKQGRGTLTITLPKKWCELVGVKNGDEIYLREHEKSLILDSDSRRDDSHIEVNFSKMNSRLIRISLNNLYRSGYSQITAHFSNNDEYREIQRVCSANFIGFEITKNSKNLCEIERISGIEPEKEAVLFRRVFLIIKETFEFLKESFDDESFSKLEIIEHNYQKVDQYLNYCFRNITINKKYEPRTYNEYLMYFNLLLMQATLRRLYHFLNKNQPENFNLIRQTLDKIRGYFELYYDSFYKKDINLIISLNESLEDMLNVHINKRISQSTGNDPVIFSYYAQIVRFLLVLISPTAAICLEESSRFRLDTLH